MELKRFGAGQSPAWSTIKKTGDRLSMVGSGVAMGCLLIAVATDHWLYTHDEINHNWIDKATNVTWFAPAEVKVHSGLWRACTYFYDVNVLRAETAVKDGGDSTLASTSDKQVAIETGQFITCDFIAPFMPLNYEETAVGLRLTITMIRSIRRATLVLLGSMLLLLTSLLLTVLGNRRQSSATMVAAMMFIITALCLAAGVILYVSAVNDEVSNRRKARLYDKFRYNYGWSLAILTLPFIGALACSVINVTVYIKRIKHRDSIIYKTIPALYELLLMI